MRRLRVHMSTSECRLAVDLPEHMLDRHSDAMNPSRNVVRLGCASRGARRETG